MSRQMKITIEGPAMCGKTTAAHILRDALTAKGRSVLIVEGDKPRLREIDVEYDVVIETKLR